jgi:hypothetical protein
MKRSDLEIIEKRIADLPEEKVREALLYLIFTDSASSGEAMPEEIAGMMAYQLREIADTAHTINERLNEAIDEYNSEV